MASSTAPNRPYPALFDDDIDQPESGYGVVDRGLHRRSVADVGVETEQQWRVVEFRLRLGVASVCGNGFDGNERLAGQLVADA